MANLCWHFKVSQLLSRFSGLVKIKPAHGSFFRKITKVGGLITVHSSSWFGLILVLASSKQTFKGKTQNVQPHYWNAGLVIVLSHMKQTIFYHQHQNEEFCNKTKRGINYLSVVEWFRVLETLPRESTIISSRTLRIFQKLYKMRENQPKKIHAISSH